MKVEAIGFAPEGRIAIHLLPETDVEKVLLLALWEHGAMEAVYGLHGPAFSISQPNIKQEHLGPET